MKVLGQDYIEQVYRLLPHDGRVVTMPINYLYCGLIMRRCPTQIIAVSRHPMDSAMRHLKLI